MSNTTTRSNGNGRRMDIPTKAPVLAKLVPLVPLGLGLDLLDEENRTATTLCELMQHVAGAYHDSRNRDGDGENKKRNTARRFVGRGGASDGALLFREGLC